MKVERINAVQAGNLIIDIRLIELFEKFQKDAGWIENYDDENHEEGEKLGARFVMHLFSRMKFATSEVVEGNTAWVITEDGCDELQRPRTLS